MWMGFCRGSSSVETTIGDRTPFSKISRLIVEGHVVRRLRGSDQVISESERTDETGLAVILDAYQSGQKVSYGPRVEFSWVSPALRPQYRLAYGFDGIAECVRRDLESFNVPHILSTSVC
jgi:hypothetical protein